jgi:hypothetical protein
MAYGLFIALLFTNFYVQAYKKAASSKAAASNGHAGSKKSR